MPRSSRVFSVRALPALALVWALQGCGSGWLDPEPVPTALPALTGDAIVWFSPTTTAPAPLPPWVQGALPVAPRLLPGPEYAALVGRVCLGADRELSERVAERLAYEAEHDAYPGPWTRELLESCPQPGPALCAWIDGQVRALPQDAPIPPGLFELWHVAGGCLDPTLWEWMPRDGGALYGVVDYLATQDAQWRPIRDPQGPDLIGRLVWETGLHQTRALQALGAADDPQAARVLLAYVKSLPKEEADAAALWLFRQRSPEAVARFDQTCLYAGEAWQCLEGWRPMDRLYVSVTSENTDLSELIERYPGYRAAILTAIGGCVADSVSSGEGRGGRCLRALFGAGETERALQVLTEIDADAVLPLWKSRIKALVEAGGTDGVRERLVSLSLIPAEMRAADPQEPPAYVVDWLVEADRGLVATGQEAGIYLRALLAQVPELSDAVVVSRPPARTAAAVGDQPLAELLVWMDGKRWRAVALPEGPDVSRLAALANTLAAERDLDVRFVVISPGDLVIWGPEDGLRALVDSGWIDVLEQPSGVVELPVVFDEDEEL